MQVYFCTAKNARKINDNEPGVARLKSSYSSPTITTEPLLKYSTFRIVVRLESSHWHGQLAQIICWKSEVCFIFKTVHSSGQTDKYTGKPIAILLNLRTLSSTRSRKSGRKVTCMTKIKTKIDIAQINRCQSVESLRSQFRGKKTIMALNSTETIRYEMLF